MIQIFLLIITVFLSNNALALNNVYPPSRYGSASWLESSSVLWLFGGGNGVENNRILLNDLWQFNNVTKQWHKVNNNSGQAPEGRYASANWLGVDNSLFLFGGHTKNYYLNDLWKYNIHQKKWIKVISMGSKPSPRYDALIWQSSQGIIYLFGGYGKLNGKNSFLNDLWTYSESTNNWKLVHDIQIPAMNDYPAARNSAATWKEANFLYLFGGYGYNKTTTKLDFLNDFWKYNLNANKWELIEQNSVNLPSPRNSMAHWNLDKYIFIFGGYGYNNYSKTEPLSDMWRYDKLSKTWELLSTKNTDIKTRYAAICWTYGKVLYLFGGYTINNTLNDLMYYSESWGVLK